jgi:hypothetical protein
MKIKMKESTKVFVISAELGILAGIIIAFYIVPATTSARMFWSIAGIFAVLVNCMLFIRVQTE